MQGLSVLMTGLWRASGAEVWDLPKSGSCFDGYNIRYNAAGLRSGDP
jgi:hypothetical protein